MRCEYTSNRRYGYQRLQWAMELHMDFEWDPAKAARNARKHGVSFVEAASVLGDPLSITAPDPDHSQDEERFIIVGISNRSRLLIVAVAERGSRIRIISARGLTNRERQAYEEATSRG